MATCTVRSIGVQVAPDDERVHTEYVEFASPAGCGKVRAYAVRAQKPPHGIDEARFAQK